MWKKRKFEKISSRFSWFVSHFFKGMNKEKYHFPIKNLISNSIISSHDFTSVSKLPQPSKFPYCDSSWRPIFVWNQTFWWICPSWSGKWFLLMRFTAISCLNEWRAGLSCELLSEQTNPLYKNKMAMKSRFYVVKSVP